MAQANAQIGIARIAYFPAATLSASAGLQSISISSWLQGPSRVWTVGPTFVETIFDGGLRQPTMQQFQAAYNQTVAGYRQTVLTAFQQVEDNLAALRVLAQAIKQEDDAIASAQRSLQEAQVRYEAGIDPYLNVISAQTVLLSYQQTAVSFRAQRMVASVQLIKALGGGWDTSQMPPAAELGKRTAATPAPLP